MNSSWFSTLKVGLKHGLIRRQNFGKRDEYFISQLKMLAGSPDVKGLSVKRVTDWLKQNSYLQEEKDNETGAKITSITKSGEEAGLYEQARSTRFGQGYKVIMYSEKAQNWIVENLPVILGETL